MENFLKLLQKTVLPDEKKLGGFFIGEKVLFCASKGKLVYLCADFVTASKLKKGLSDCGRRVQIVSCGRENEDEKDINLFPFARSISDFLNDHLDVLIFLPFLPDPCDGLSHTSGRTVPSGSPRRKFHSAGKT